MSHKVQTVVKLLALGCAWTDIYSTQTDIYGAQIDTHATWTDRFPLGQIHMPPGQMHMPLMDTYDLMSDKYITQQFINFIYKILNKLIHSNNIQTQ